MPQGVNPQELEGVLKALSIPARVMQVGQYIILTGDATSLADSERLIRNIRMSEATSSATVTTSMLNYKIMAIPESISFDEMMKTAESLELNLKFEKIGDNALVIGKDSEITFFERVVIDIVKAKKASSKSVTFVKKLTGIDGNDLYEYLTARGVEISVTEIADGYLLSGNAEELTMAGELIEYLTSEREKRYRKVERIALSPEKLEGVFSELAIDVKLFELDDALLLIGNETEIERAQKIIDDLNKMPTAEATESVAKLPVIDGWDISKVKEYLLTAGVEIESLFEIDGALVAIGTMETIGRARELLSLISNDQGYYLKLSGGVTDEEQLQNVISTMNLRVKYVVLENGWLLVGNKDDVEKLKEIMEKSSKKEYIKYVKAVSPDATELVSIVEAAFPQVNVSIYEKLGMLLLKSYDEEALNNAVEFVEGILSVRDTKSLEESIKIHDNLVDIDVEKADLKAVLKKVAADLGISLLVDEAIDDTITISAKNLNWEDFLSILEHKGYSVSVVGSLYVVSVKQANADNLTISATEEQIYRIYHNVEEFKSLIEFYGGTVYSDPINGIVVVKGIERSRVLEILQKLESAFSSPKKQVKIETKIMDKSLYDNLTKQLQASLNFGSSSPQIVFNKDSIGLSFEVMDIVDFPELLENLITTASATVTASLSQDDSDSDIVSNPSIVALSGEEASIHIGDTIPYTTKKVLEDGTIIEELNYLNTGVEMTITPTINGDGTIMLDLYIKVSDPQQYGDYYGEKTREAQTKLMISDGNSLSIGGLITEKETVNVTKLPFLGDLPFIGKLFTSEKKSKEQREMVIIITAKVVEP
ncbi:type II secretion system protein GspD [Kosmotoga arenicorallina]|uniref:type II secretion system protein GspD n=1 Tax=Kosmotoga arenicorallina TaxID=688066 RepID=UPI001372DD1A|nr:type II and III secretion system protein [Kosmotoga arenicorallina]